MTLDGSCRKTPKSRVISFSAARRGRFFYARSAAIPACAAGLIIIHDPWIFCRFPMAGRAGPKIFPAFVDRGGKSPYNKKTEVRIS